MNKRYDWVDYAKGIGILLVVYAHIARGVFSSYCKKRTKRQQKISGRF